jgi:hypothetical protein
MSKKWELLFFRMGKEVLLLSHLWSQKTIFPRSQTWWKFPNNYPHNHKYVTSLKLLWNTITILNHKHALVLVPSYCRPISTRFVIMCYVSGAIAGCACGVTYKCHGTSWFFADIFFYLQYIPRSTAYYFEPQTENLMIVKSLCWELLVGWMTWRLGLKLLRACRRILPCRPVAGS